ncbi:hypothetical protein F3Y22_tig00110419pilonHSYRG00071 [Hibiscus syriacus]|uniref:Uncharacterized protein n=1 Tax=Hibiscus syriacus TaxID=106335 RepID=A0A6A3AP39_HIBSY|nr:uncharacterized protein LOC120124573 [Hibiscus syriacus]KAE8705623.1 hypothetical protein F3Y22_tig00110419pilonHSYRG00071 [Hibiscus syriacus]
MRNTISIASIFFTLFVIQIHARTDPRPCTTSCGDIHNIGYPFRLRGDPSHCGDPDYELYCDPNNRTILDFHAGLYYVSTISYADRLIRLVDVNLATGNCGLPYRSLGIGEVLGDGRYNRKYSSPHATFVRCSEEINSMRNNIVPCLTGNTYRVYLNYTDFMLYPLDIPSSCSVFSMVLSGSSDDRNVNFPTTYDDIRRKLQFGFDLTWTVECRDCLADGGYCQFATEETTGFDVARKKITRHNFGTPSCTLLQSS